MSFGKYISIYLFALKCFFKLKIFVNNFLRTCKIELSVLKCPLAEHKAAKLLPLADEYQLENLKSLYGKTLVNMENPRLEVATLMQKYHTGLLDEALSVCARNIPFQATYTYYQTTDMTQQLQLPENADLSKETQILIYRYYK